MSVPRLSLNPFRPWRPPAWPRSSFERQLRLADERPQLRTRLTLDAFEDRTTPSASPYYVPTSQSFSSLHQPDAVVRRELVLIDPRVSDFASLIRDLRANSNEYRQFEIVVLDARRDGIEQVSEILSRRRNLDAIHFVTHGTDGGIQLGGSWLNQAALTQRSDLVSGWSRALGSEADLLFYGCNFAAGTSGRSLLNSIRHLTGADVAASTDRTGSAILGGDWDLEFRSGLIESQIAFSLAEQRIYSGAMAVFVVTSKADSGAGSLRDAINQANALAGADTINFNIAGLGPHVINVLSALPTITGTVLIDGRSDPDFAGQPIIELNGASAGPSVNGLNIKANNVIVRGLVIRQFSLAGILLAGSGATIVGNYIGTDVSGLLDRGNYDGIEISGDNNTIGGAAAIDRNVLSGNDDEGVDINPGADGNIVVGNLIGVDATGTGPLGNGKAGTAGGLLIEGNNNRIGGLLSWEANVIAYNAPAGIIVNGGTGNAILQNSIYANSNIGIDLGNNGVTPNDAGDTDTGPNSLLNVPVIYSVVVWGGNVTITGEARAGAIVEFFEALADATGHGQGQIFIGRGSVSGATPGIVDATSRQFSFTFSRGSLIGGDVVTATATDASNNTSEFAANIAVIETGFVVTPTSGLITTEAGGTAQFSVVLKAKPTADVVINLISSNPAEGKLSTTTLTFTAANWNIAQIVTISGIDEFTDDGDQSYSIILSPATSADPFYNGLDPVDVSVTNTDDDTAGILVTPISGLVTTEAGGQATFSVVLTSQPVADVVINLASSNSAEGKLSTTTLTFTAANWNVAQIVTVTGIDEFIDDGDQAYTIILNAATSADPNYNGLDPGDVSVTNTDDDTAGILVTPLTGLVTTESGGTASFSVVLTSQPVTNVTITLSETQPSEGKLSTTTLVFNAANWNTPQIVTVTGLDDFVVDGMVSNVIILHPASSKDPNYDNLDAPDVSTVNADDDVAAVVVTPISGLVTTEAGGTASFSVVLTSQPIADVVINLSVSIPGEGKLSTTSLVFTAANWKVAQIVTVTGINDFVDDGDRLFTVILDPAISADANYIGFDPTDVSVTNIDDDKAGILVSPITGLVTSEGGGTAQFSVVLASQPTFDVIINLSLSNPAEGKLSTTTITFSAANWNNAQIITVTGIDDFVDDGDQMFTVMLEPAISSDTNYNGLDPSDVSVTNTDDDIAGIVVSPITGLVTTEAGGSATFSVVLTSQPLADVVINLVSSNLAEGTLSTTKLTFTAGNWNTAQVIIVTGIDESIDDGDQLFTVILDPAISSDGKFNGLDPSDVNVTNIDDDAAGILVSPISGLVTTEAGGMAQFTVVLTSQPVADVVINLASSQPAEGKLSTTTLIFTSANWNLAQTVSITGIDDFIVDGDQAYTIIFSPASSADANYNGRDPIDVSVTNTDDDKSGIVVNPITSLITTEAGGTAQFSVVLTSQPVADVVINLASSNSFEGKLSTTSLTFNASNWNIAQIVTVTGVNEFIDDGDQAYTIILSAASSTDPNYDGLDPADVNITNTDDDVAGIVVTPIAGLVTTEAGGTASFSVVLTSQPTADVVITLSSSNVAEGTLSTTVLTFTAANWNIAQLVTVTGVNDFVADGDQAYSILLAPATSTDANYNALDPTNVSATNKDDDGVGIVVTPVTGLSTAETGTIATFSVVLTSQPTADVVITLVSSNPTEGTISTINLTFTAINWDTAQIVTVTGVDDFIADGNQTFTVILNSAMSADSNYDGLNVADVVVINLDNDTAGIVATPGTGLITTESGTAVTFSIVLASQPTADVTIQLKIDRVTEGQLDVGSLTFTTAKWKSAQFVTVTGLNDFVDDGDQVFTIIIGPAVSGDLSYDGQVIPNVTGVNVDDDTSGFVIVADPILIVREDGQSASFQIALTSEPIAPVTFRLVSGNPGEVEVITTLLTFDSTNWSTPQTVQIKGVADLVDDGDITVQVMALSFSIDPLYESLTGNVTVSNLHVDDSGPFGETGNPLSTAVTPGTTTIGGPGNTGGVEIKSEPIQIESVMGTSSSNPEFKGHGSGSAEIEDGGLDRGPANGLPTQPTGALPPNRAGLSPSLNQLLRKPLGRVPVDAAGAALPMLRHEPLRDSFGRMDRDLKDDQSARMATVQVSLGASVVASAGYVLWTLRGAAWMASALASSLPTWTAFDPLVLLAGRRRDEEDDNDDDDSLTNLIDSTEHV